MTNALWLLAAAAAVACAVALWRIAAEIAGRRRDAIVIAQLAMFGPVIAAANQDPRLLLAWYPIAQANRKLFPDAFRELDRAAGSTFPFPKELLKAAHAKCSSDWLAWERAHDAEFSLKTADVQREIDAEGHSASQASSFLRTRLAAIEQQKLERYQQRYEEYIKTAKALAGFHTET